MVLLIAWITSLGVIGYIIGFLMLILSIFLFVCEIVGIVVMIKWIAGHGTSERKSKTGLNKQEQEWLFGKK